MQAQMQQQLPLQAVAAQAAPAAPGGVHAGMLQHAQLPTVQWHASQAHMQSPSTSAATMQQLAPQQQTLLVQGAPAAQHQASTAPLGPALAVSGPSTGMVPAPLPAPAAVQHQPVLVTSPSGTPQHSSAPPPSMSQAGEPAQPATCQHAAGPAAAPSGTGAAADRAASVLQTWMQLYHSSSAANRTGLLRLVQNLLGLAPDSQEWLAWQQQHLLDAPAATSEEAAGPVPAEAAASNAQAGSMAGPQQQHLEPESAAAAAAAARQGPAAARSAPSAAELQAQPSPAAEAARGTAATKAGPTKRSSKASDRRTKDERGRSPAAKKQPSSSRRRSRSKGRKRSSSRGRRRSRSRSRGRSRSRSKGRRRSRSRSKGRRSRRSRSRSRRRSPFRSRPQRRSSSPHKGRRRSPSYHKLPTPKRPSKASRDAAQPAAAEGRQMKQQSSAPVRQQQQQAAMQPEVAPAAHAVLRTSTHSCSGTVVLPAGGHEQQSTMHHSKAQQLAQQVADHGLQQEHQQDGTEPADAPAQAAAADAQRSLSIQALMLPLSKWDDSITALGDTGSPTAVPTTLQQDEPVYEAAAQGTYAPELLDSAADAAPPAPLPWPSAAAGSQQEHAPKPPPPARPPPTLPPTQPATWPITTAAAPTAAQPPPWSAHPQPYPAAGPVPPSFMVPSQAPPPYMAAHLHPYPALHQAPYGAPFPAPGMPHHMAMAGPYPGHMLPMAAPPPSGLAQPYPGAMPPPFPAPHAAYPGAPFPPYPPAALAPAALNNLINSTLTSDLELRSALQRLCTAKPHVAAAVTPDVLKALETCGRTGCSLQGLLALHYLHVFHLDTVSAPASAQARCELWCKAACAGIMCAGQPRWKMGMKLLPRLPQQWKVVLAAAAAFFGASKCCICIQAAIIKARAPPAATGRGSAAPNAHAASHHQHQGRIQAQGGHQLQLPGPV
jgi:hypothetical protein